MDAKNSMKNKPRLGHMPGLERLDMPTDDFEYKERQPLMIWSVVFFAIGAGCLVLSRTVDAGGQGTLLFVLLFLLFASLGAVTLLSRLVRTPA